MMNKEQLVAKYSETYEISKKQAKQNIEEVIDMIQKAVIEDDGVKFIGFMSIEKVHKEAGKGRNPQTGAEMDIPAKDVPKAKFSDVFKKAVNGEA